MTIPEWENGRTFSKMFSIKGFSFCHIVNIYSFMTIPEWENGRMENLFENVLYKRVFIL